MKFSFTLLIGLFLCFTTFSQIQGNDAVAKGACTEVRVIEVPEYDECYGYTGYGSDCGDTQCCNMIFVPSHYLATPLYRLQERDQTGVWVNVGGGQQFDNVFSNLPKGEYRVEVTLPQINRSCQVQLEEYPYTDYLPWELWYFSNYIGYLATWDGTVVPYQPPLVYYTYPVLVGPTTSDDLDYIFLQNGVLNQNSAYNEGEDVIVDASDSKNYNNWYLAIKENPGATTRYKSQGWTDGEIDDPLDLTEFWHGWEFEAFNMYEVQIAIENRQCRNGIEWPGTSWTVKEEKFWVCPPGSGCRFAFDREVGELGLYPNPARNFVTLDNYDQEIHGELELTIYNIRGKQMLSSRISDSTIDVSHLPPGAYLVKVRQKSNEIQSFRLIVQ